MENVKTPLGRFAFTGDLFKPREQESGKLQYGCTILFPKTTDIGVLKKVAAEAAKEKWGDKAVELLKSGAIRSPFLDGDSKDGLNKKSGERLAGFEGCTFIRPKSGEKYPPVVVGPRKERIDDANAFYSGVWGYAIVNAYAWEHPKNGKGISFSISAVQKARDDERLGGGGGIDVDAAFDTIEDTGNMASVGASGDGAADLFS